VALHGDYDSLEVAGYPPLYAAAPQPPAETDMQEYFRVSPPSVQQMVLALDDPASSEGSQERLRHRGPR
jgi:hypothetical protein